MSIPRKILRALLGLAAWTAIALLLASALFRERGEAPSAFEELRRWAAAEPMELTLRLPDSTYVEVGDAVFLRGRSDRQAGRVVSFLDSEGGPDPRTWGRTSRVRLLVYDRNWPALHEDASATLVRVPDTSGAWVVKTLVPPEKMAEVERLWGLAWRRHQGEIVRSLRPIAIDFLRDAQRAVSVEVRPFIDRHRDEIQRLLRRAETELAPDKLSRVFESDVWPIIRGHVEPVTDKIGKEIWSRFPLWGISWRLAFQTLPFTRDDYFDRRWKQFIDDEVVPLLRARIPEFIEITRSIARDALANPRVAAFAHDIGLRLLGDPAFHQLLQLFLDEVILHGPALRHLVERYWESARVQRAVALVSSRLESTVREIGDLLLGTRKTGITPEFAQVLRAQILLKDRRRILLDPGSPERPWILPGATIAATVELEEKR